MSKVKAVPPRSKVKLADQWKLTSLFANDEAWEREFRRWEKRIPKYAEFHGTLAESPASLAACLKFDLDFERKGERIGTYAFLKSAVDLTDSTYQSMVARVRNAGRRASEIGSYIRPEILSIPHAKLTKFLKAKELAPYALLLERMTRYKKHTLSKKEERLLAMQGQISDTANQVFRQLNDSDLQFGFVKNDRGDKVELTQSSLSTLLQSPKRPIRKKAFHQFYETYKNHENTLAATLNGSIQRDVFSARVRRFSSAREAALFPDRVPLSVYDNLIDTVHANLDALYRYYEVRRRAMNLKEIHHYDTYVPILSERKVRHTFDQAVDVVVNSLEPLGNEYTSVLGKGLRTGWCDKYENKGKQSGAFSCGSYDADPYILMNYQPEVLDHVFTLAHEAGHSMHSHFSSKKQPYQYHDYSIFVAEVASTFNEQLLSGYLLGKAKSDRERAYLINREIDDIRGTILRQTMFAEFEKVTHELAEKNEPLTVDRLKEEYRSLLELYFGPDFVLDEELSLECFRIPHFYRAFYVYKYATGMSAAIALSQRVLDGGRRELSDYLGFLKGGCSQYPLDLLRGAGVDMESPEPVNSALNHFRRRVEELDELLTKISQRAKRNGRPSGPDRSKRNRT